MRISRHDYILVVAGAAAIIGVCAGTANFAPSASAARLPLATRVTGAAIKPDHAPLLVSETFADTETPANEWVWSAPACLTAGTATTPLTSVPACGGSARQNRPGHGVVELTPPQSYQVSLVGYYQPFSTAHGLRIRYNLYSYDGNGSDGTLLWMTYGDKPEPTVPAGTGGHLGYIDGTVGDLLRNGYRPGARSQALGLANAYLGIGFDEFGNFSAFLPSGPGLVPDTVAVGGAESIGYNYLTGVENASGQPVSLPFSMEQPSSRRRPKHAPSVEIKLERNGLLEVAFDIHNGQGYVTYLSRNIVGIAGQPRVPRSVYIGINGSNGANYERHQIDDLRIWALH